MIRGIYTTAAAMVVNMIKATKTANNAANVDTPGYKRDIIRAKGYEGMTLSRADDTSSPSAPVTLGYIDATSTVIGAGFDRSQGRLISTGQPLDLALSGPGYFVVEKADHTYYTRNGTFIRNAEGQLGTIDGGVVMGDGGVIALGDGETLVAGDGTITIDGAVVAKLKLVAFDATTELRKVGNSYLAPLTTIASSNPETTTVSQGYLEGSNVDLVATMVDITTVARSYEASQRLLRFQDEVLSQAVNEVGKLA